MILLQIHRKLRMESDMCDVIKIHAKRRDATGSGKENQPLNIKTAAKRPILKIGVPNLRWGFISLYLSLHPSF